MNSLKISFIIALSFLAACSDGGGQGFGSESLSMKDSDGVSYTLKIDANQASLNSNGASIVNDENCSARSSVNGVGRWEWSNGGVLIQFPNKRIGFPRQESPFESSVCEQDVEEAGGNEVSSGELLFAGLVNTLNTGTLTGSCKGVFSHIAIQANKLFAQAKDRSEADQYLRAGEIGGILSKRIGNSFNKNVPPSELGDYFQSVNESMYRMQELDDPEIAYQAYNYCRNEF